MEGLPWSGCIAFPPAGTNHGYAIRKGVTRDGRTFSGLRKTSEYASWQQVQIDRLCGQGAPVLPHGFLVSVHLEVVAPNARMDIDAPVKGIDDILQAVLARQLPPSYRVVRGVGRWVISKTWNDRFVSYLSVHRTIDKEHPRVEFVVKGFAPSDCLACRGQEPGRSGPGQDQTAA